MSFERDITACLLAWQADPQDAVASGHLANIIYQRLRELAHARLLRESVKPFTPTELVHETWLQLKPPGNQLTGRSQFLKLASTVMRNLLVDQARERLSQKRGGDRVCVTLAIADHQQPFDDERLLDLEYALNALGDAHPRHVDVINLRCFGGLKLGEIADTLNVSLATVKRDWVFARAWLADALREGHRGGGRSAST